MHIDRMEKKWSNIYKTVLGCDLGSATDQPVAVTDQHVSSVTDQPVATNPNTHPYCEKLNGWTAECSSEQCYPYVQTFDYYWNNVTMESSDDEFTCKFTLSTECDPNFADRYGDDCEWYVESTGENCQHAANGELLQYGVLTAEGFKTGLNCPACGCGANGPINMQDRDDSRSLTGEDMKIKKN